MNKVAQYLQEHVTGEVEDSLEVRRYYSTDASILTITPTMVVFPKSENDVRKTARFSWQLAERGQTLPITPRGGGTDTSGAAIGDGIILNFSRHMHRIQELDARQRLANVQAGVAYHQLEAVLETHGLSFPPYPGSASMATLGGGIANNSMGPRSLKYGSTGDYVESLRVVLANGEVIETRPLGKRELNQKLGLTTFEGEIYRQFDTLLEENNELIAAGTKVRSLYNAAGLNVFNIKDRDSFDLTPLFIGSQGTLGIITEATLRAEPVAKPIVALASFEKLEQLEKVMPAINDLNPSLLEIVTHGAFNSAREINPAYYRDVVSHPAADAHIIIEFDNFKEGDQKRLIKSLEKIVDRVGGQLVVPGKPSDKQKLDKVRRTSAMVMSGSDKKPLPVVEDLSVPTEEIFKIMKLAQSELQAADLPAAIWADGGGVIKLRPLLDIGEIGDRQKLFKLADKLYSAAIEAGGSTTASAGDGRVRAHYNNQIYGEKLYSLMLEVKKIFDPRGILNPGVKSISADEMKALLRQDYEHAYRHQDLYL